MSMSETSHPRMASASCRSLAIDAPGGSSNSASGAASPTKRAFWEMATQAPCTDGSHSFAGQLAGLLHPISQLSFVDLVVLVDVDVAHFFLLGLARREGAQRLAAEESQLDVLRET